MTREIDKSLIVPFGKYKGKPVEALLQDPSYVNWFVGNDDVKQKYKDIYAVIINNFNTQTLDTPEHNQMQIRFLSEAHSLKLAFLVSNKVLFQYDNKHFCHHAPQFINDLKERNINPAEFLQQFQKNKGINLLRLTKIDCETKEGLDVKYDVSYGYGSILSQPEYLFHRVDDLFNKFWDKKTHLSIRVELKPSIGDDFPSVLRQMKASKANILLIREYTGAGVTFDEFVKFFASQGMKVFTEEEVNQVILPKYDECLVFDENLFQ